MRYIIKFCLALLIFGFFSITALPSAHAASQATMQVKAEISDSKFWDYPFIKNTIPSKPSTVKVEWSFGATGSNEKEVTIISAGKTLGQIDITSAKGESINLSIYVKNAKNETLGKWGMLIINKGQTQDVKISIPETIQPVFTNDNT